MSQKPQVCKESMDTKWNFQHGGLNQTKKKTIQRGGKHFQKQNIHIVCENWTFISYGNQRDNALVTLLEHFSLQTF